MLEHSSFYPEDPELQKFQHSHSSKTEPCGLNKIVAVGYDQNKSQRLPISRYSLKVNVVGLGTSGAVSAIGFAALGHKVIAVDHDQRKVNALNQGRVRSDDLKLKALVKQVRRLNNLVATSDLHNAILSTNLTMICMGNSVINDSVTAQDSMTSVIEQISATISSKRHFHLIIVCQPESYVDKKNSMGTDIEQSTGKILGKDFGLSFIPLKLNEKQALSDFYSLPNMTVTISDTKSESLVQKLFNGFTHKIKYVRYKKM